MDKFIWIDSNGVETPLTGNSNFTLLSETRGLYMPPFLFSDEAVPFQAGSRLRHITVTAREIDLPMKIKGASRAELHSNLRKLLKIFNPMRGDGKLRMIAADGTERELHCRYIGGFEIDEATSISGRTWQKAIGVFRAFDPYWYDATTNVETFKTGEPATFFPIFPMRLSDSNVFADITIDNTGDVETWPEWIIKGPGDHIILRNLSTGEIFNLNATIAEGETIIIDTRPGKKTVLKNNGANLFSVQTSDSTMWPLREGKNNVRIEMSSANANSSVQLSYHNRYWGP